MLSCCVHKPVYKQSTLLTLVIHLQLCSQTEFPCMNAAAKMNSLVRLSSSKGSQTPFERVKPVDQKHSMVEPNEPAANDDETYWDTKEPPVSVREKIRFLWWSILIILSQMWRDVLDFHNGFASLFLTDLLSHFFVSHN